MAPGTVHGTAGALNAPHHHAAQAIIKLRPSEVARPGCMARQAGRRSRCDRPGVRGITMSSEEDAAFTAWRWRGPLQRRDDVPVPRDAAGARSEERRGVSFADNAGPHHAVSSKDRFGEPEERGMPLRHSLHRPLVRGVGASSGHVRVIACSPTPGTPSTIRSRQLADY